MPDYSGPKPAKLPDNFTGLTCIPIVDGNAKVYFLREGKSLGSFDCTPSQLATLASDILNMASTIQFAVPDSNAQSEMPLLTVPPILANRFGLQSNSETGYETLTVQVGGAVVGFAIQNKILASLGRALLAASATKEKPN